MASNNLAYDLSKYEDIKPEKAEKVAIKKVSVQQQAGSAPKVIILTLMAGLLMGGVIYSKVQNASLQAEIADQTTAVDVLHSENVRMATEIQGKSAFKVVEEYAEDILGMQKLDKSQVDYISMESGNVVEIPEDSNNLFVRIKNAFDDFVEYLRG